MMQCQNGLYQTTACLIEAAGHKQVNQSQSDSGTKANGRK